MREDRITRALEQAPAVTVPADFAARVMAQLPERKVARVPAGFEVHRTHYGRNAMLVGAALLCCLLLVGRSRRREMRRGGWRSGRRWHSLRGSLCGAGWLGGRGVPCSKPSAPVRLFPFGLPIEQQSIEMLRFCCVGHVGYASMRARGRRMFVDSPYPHASFWLDVVDKGVKAIAVAIGGLWTLMALPAAAHIQGASGARQ